MTTPTSKTPEQKLTDAKANGFVEHTEHPDAWGPKPTKKVQSYLKQQHDKHVDALTTHLKQKYNVTSDDTTALAESPEYHAELAFMNYVGAPFDPMNQGPSSDPKPFLDAMREVVPEFAANAPWGEPEDPEPEKKDWKKDWDWNGSADPDEDGDSDEDTTEGSRTGITEPIKPLPEHKRIATRIQKQSRKLSGFYQTSEDGKKLHEPWNDRLSGNPEFHDGMSNEMKRIARRLESGSMTWEDVYRSYKNSPHHPMSLFGKYLVHRLHNVEAYDDKYEAAKLDDSFLKSHQLGRAGDKNGQITPLDLQHWATSNGHILGQMMTHKDQLHARILRGVGLNVRTIHGEPYVALTRSLNSDIMNREHKLSSWSDDASINFGNVRHHAWVPLHDLWFSYDMGPKYPSGNMGPETEYLLSDSKTRYEADPSGNDTKPNRFREWHERFSRHNDGDSQAEFFEPLQYDNVTDEQVGDALRKYMKSAPGWEPGSVTVPGDNHGWSDFLNHPNAGPATWAAFKERFSKVAPSDFTRAWYSNAAPVEEAMQYANDPEVREYIRRKQNLKPEDITRLLHLDPDIGRQMATENRKHPGLRSEHMAQIAEAVIDQHMFKRQSTGSPDRPLQSYDFGRAVNALVGNPLTSKGTILRLLEYAQHNHPWGIDHHEWDENPHTDDPEVTRAYYRVKEAYGKALNTNASSVSGVSVSPIVHSPLPTDMARHHLDLAKKRENAPLDDADYFADGDMEPGKPETHPRHTLSALQSLVSSPKNDLNLQMEALEAFPDVLLRSAASQMAEKEFPAVFQTKVVGLLLKDFEAGGVGDGMGANKYRDAIPALERIAASEHLAPEVVEMLVHSGSDALRNDLARNKSPNVVKAFEEILARHGVSDDAINASTGESADIRDMLDFAPHVQGAQKNVVNAVAVAVAKRRAYAARRSAEHIIKPFPVGMAKAERDPWFTANMHQWLAGQTKRRTGQDGYHYATHYRDAMRILDSGIIQPKATNKLLDGFAVFAHHASPDEHHVRALLSQAHREDDHPVILHFETHEPPEGTHAGQPYWLNDVKVHNCHVAHQGENPLAKMAIADIAPGKLKAHYENKTISAFKPGLGGTKVYDYSHVLSPAHKAQMQGLKVEVEERGTGNVTALLYHNGDIAGRVKGTITHSPTSGRKGVRIGFAEIHDDVGTDGQPLYHGKRLGQALYNAVLAHSKHIAQAEVAFGGDHSTLAHAAWKRLAAQHGLKYEAEQYPYPPVNRRGPFDDAFGPYEMELKSEKGALNLLNRKPLEDWELDTAHAMLGHHPFANRALKAAQWLSGRKVAANDDVYRMALRVHDGDHERAALHAYGLTDSEEHLKALRGLIASESFAKSEDTEPVINSVEAGFLEATQTANEVKRAAKSGSVQTLHLSGKHSKGSMAAKDPETEHVWLLKPGSGSQSPAAGSRDHKATQSMRETAFWHIADKYGLGGFYPQCDLLMVNGQQVAAMRLLASSFDNLDKKARKDKTFATRVLEPYRKSGLVHRWAILDWVLGNPDRHGQNLMVDRNNAIMLIDHGSAFAGKNFDPAHDPKSFIPFYLRVWGPKDFFELAPEDRMKFMPEVDVEVEKHLKAFLDTITPEALSSMLAQYGIEPGPELERLDMLKRPSRHPLCVRVNAVWAGLDLEDEEEEDEPMAKAEPGHPFTALEAEYKKVWGKTAWPACDKVAQWAVGALSKQGVKATAVQGYMDGNPEHYHWWAEAHHGGKRWIIDGARAQFQLLTGDKRPFAVFPHDHKEAGGYQLEAEDADDGEG